MKLCRGQADPGVVVTAGPVGSGEMLDTEARCRCLEGHGCQAMAGQAFQGLALPGPHPSAAWPEQWSYGNRLDSNAAFSLASWKHHSDGPPALPETHGIVSGQSDTTKPQQLSSSSSLLGSIHPMGFASRWQATPGRGPGQPHLATELLGSIQTAERSLPGSPAPSLAIPTPAPAPGAALSQTTRTCGCSNTLWEFAALKRWTKKSRCSAEAAWRCLVPIPAVWRREPHSAI